MSKNTHKDGLVRFTTLIDPQILSNIKLLSYFTNKKLYEVINESLDDYVSNFEQQNNTSIKTLINLQHKFSTNVEDDNEVVTKDKK